MGAQHYHTTAYHPAANGMVERLHRQLKAAIMCHSTSRWTEALPLVLLGVRSAWKEDVQASAAELVYGEPLRLPGQFLSPSDDHTTADMTQLATRLRSHMAKLTPKSTTWHRISPFYVPRDLNNSSHVFLRQDHVRRSLEPPYAGPFKVLERHPKYYKVEVSGKPVNVSLDRLKPAYLMKEAQLPAAHPAPAALQPAPAAPTEIRSRSGQRVRFPDRYRP